MPASRPEGPERDEAPSTCACMVLCRRSVLLGCTSSHHTSYRGRWKEYMGTGPARREGWCRSASCPTIHMKLSGCFLSLKAVSSTRRSREQPGIPCIDPSCSCANCRAKNAYTSIVHHLGVAISAPVSFKGWRLVTLADRRLRVWRLHWSRSALPPPN